MGFITDQLLANDIFANIFNTFGDTEDQMDDADAKDN